MTATAIEWADRVWNPVTGCTKVSQGCKHCYAEVVANRFFGRRYPEVEVPSDPSLRCGAPSQQWSTRPRVFTDVQTHADRLDAPLRWRKPARVFVNSMSDLFHESVPDEFIDRVFAVMALAPRHTFLVLTKRPERMRAYLATNDTYLRVRREVEEGEVAAASRSRLTTAGRRQLDAQWWTPLPPSRWPLPNVWLGVSVEDQATADQRIPLLLQTPAAVRWVSYEPALAGVDFTDVVVGRGSGSEHHINALSMEDDNVSDDEEYSGACLNWVVVGGESGPKARQCNVAWIASVVEQCARAGVACFVKQLGESQIGHLGDVSGPVGFVDALVHVGAFRKSRKGSDPAEWPADLRVREFPAVSR